MKIITSQNMPLANGHYSQCIEHNGVLYISGQLPIENKEVPDTLKEQVFLVFKKLFTILEAANSKYTQVIQVRIYISDIKYWDEVNEYYTQIFKEHKPVRVVVPTRELHYGCLIEVEATAYI